MSCPPTCPREQTSRDDASPGVIGPEEEICRGLFPSDRGKSGVKRSSIPAGHLWNGQLSVWRVSELAKMTVDQLVTVLEPLMIREGNERFDEIRCVRAERIRQLQIADARAVSLLDECVMDREGNKHPAHAHIALCEVIKASIEKSDDCA